MRALRPIVVMFCALALAVPPAGAASSYFKILYDSLPQGTYEALGGWEDPLRAHLKVILEADDDPESAAAVREILDLIALPHLPFESEELIGAWRVRSLQANGLGAYAYGWFPARIYREEQALVFDKDAGSQRHRGLMAQASEDTVFFAGALYYGYETPRLHSAHMDPGIEADPAMDATALIYKLGPGHFLMVFDHAPAQFRFYEMMKEGEMERVKGIEPSS